MVLLGILIGVIGMGIFECIAEYYSRRKTEAILTKDKVVHKGEYLMRELSKEAYDKLMESTSLKGTISTQQMMWVLFINDAEDVTGRIKAAKDVGGEVLVGEYSFRHIKYLFSLKYDLLKDKESDTETFIDAGRTLDGRVFVDEGATIPSEEYRKKFLPKKKNTMFLGKF